MRIDSDLESFESVLDDNPDNWEHRMVYADWLEEQVVLHGHQELTGLSRAMRFMAMYERRPYFFGWWAWCKLLPREWDVCSALPSFLFNWESDKDVVLNASRREAEQALADAFEDIDVYNQACAEMEAVLRQSSHAV